MAVRFVDDRGREVHGHELHMVCLDGARKDLDGVCSIPDLLVNASAGFGDGVCLGNQDVERGEVFLDIDRSLDPEGFADCENARPDEFADLDLRADVVSVRENRGDVEHAGEPPAGEHGLEL